MQFMLIAISYTKPFDFLETFKRLMNIWNSQTELRKTKVLELLEQNVHAKITLQPGNTRGRTEAIFNPFANSLSDLEESDDDEPLVPITKPHVRSGHGETSKGSIYASETRSTYSPGPHLQVLGTLSEPSASFESDTTVDSCGRPSTKRASPTKWDNLDRNTCISPTSSGVSENCYFY